MAMQYVCVVAVRSTGAPLSGSQEPVLPRAADVRAAQIEQVRKISEGEPADKGPGGGKKKRPAGEASAESARRDGSRPEPAENGATAPESSSAGARRRRRYASGRRRGRR
jgi:hypothetical protein